MTDKAAATTNAVDDLLGGTAKPKTATKKAAPAAKPAAKAAPAAKAPKAEKAAPVAKAPKAEKVAREAVVFEEGEREALAKRVKQTVRKPWNSKELAVKLEISTRKLRQVLYGMKRAGTIGLDLAASRALGMTVTPVSAAA